MMKTYTVTLFALLSASVFVAGAEPAKEASAPAGTTTLKLEPPSNPMREARKELEKVEKEIVQLDTEIRSSTSQAAAARAISGGSGRTATMQALDTANRMKRDELIAKRMQLQEELKSAAADRE